MAELLAQVASKIRDEIGASGPISFARFMEIALYTPDHGYYRSRRDPFGSPGDFYTAEQLQPVFGETVAEFVRVRASESGPSFSVRELGAGRAELSIALAEWNYLGVDYGSSAAVDPFEGILIANEFFDALPVLLLRRGADGWREMRVDWKGAFEFVEAGPDEAMRRYAERYGEAIPVGGWLEVNTGIGDWLTRMASMLRQGTLLVIDYGYSAEELRRFPSGSLLSYRRHTAIADVLGEPGERDITAHVNFSELRAIAVECGFEIESDGTLRRWMLSIWSEEKLKARWREADLRWRMQWKKLTFEMGESFRVLLLRKREDGK